ncbi:putative lipid II flippase FtsW [Haliangium ochraceum]|uniref:Probable peptidoglycan glycosyltransferase FtsW n=1 Tax=Haliangium ochraceum (strain DSM 14365 / JCM 11303 / SMP-2) TaxID=502025 RepID=D0LZ33_HALO1|nr:putative lipid II flippase FtsW [Haliangium ochraceum]ACY14503.1 cell division protein FtsW [Haliangium ochraceum DSM 14365]
MRATTRNSRVTPSNGLCLPILDDGDTERTQAPSLNQAPIVEVSERGFDMVLVSTVVILLIIGTVEIFSASAVLGLRRHGDAMHFVKRQLVWMVVGSGAMWFAANTSYRWLKRWTYPLLAFTLLLLVAVLFTRPINGAKRWFQLGLMSFQPVEIAKLVLVTYLAHSLSKKADQVKQFTNGFVPHIVVCSLMMGLVLLQPDLGSSVILGTTTLVLLFVAGAKLSYLTLAVLSAAPVAYMLIVGTPWRMRRFLAFFNPEAYSLGVAYQSVQASIAIGSGGLTGLGLGEGRQQLGYMLEGHNDYIMASVGEELGFVGFALVLALFVVLVWRGVRAAVGARDVFGSYIAFGITVTFAIQALINTGVVLGALPAKGLTLPFVSYGGSSLLMAMFFAGLLLNVGRRAPPKPRTRELVNRIGGGRKRRPRAVIVVS